jgi:hypothetical protein
MVFVAVVMAGLADVCLALLAPSHFAKAIADAKLWGFRSWAIASECHLACSFLCIRRRGIETESLFRKRREDVHLPALIL